jgi:hypothetical protein
MEHLVNPKFDNIDDNVKPPQFISESLGMIRTATGPTGGTGPTGTNGHPTRLIDQLKIINDSGTRKLRIYDTSNGTWYDATLT